MEGGGSEYFQRGVGADGIDVTVMPIFLSAVRSPGRFSVFRSTTTLPGAPPVSNKTGFRSYSHVPTDKKLRFRVQLTLRGEAVPFGDAVAWLDPCEPVMGLQDLACKETAFIGNEPFVLAGDGCQALEQGTAFFEVEYGSACPSGVFGCGFVVKVLMNDYLFTSRPIWGNVETHHPDAVTITGGATCVDRENCTFALQAVYKQAFESAVEGAYRVEVYYDTAALGVYKPKTLGDGLPLNDYPNGTRVGEAYWGAWGRGEVDMLPILTSPASVELRFRIVCELGATAEGTVTIVPRTVDSIVISDLVPTDLSDGELRASRGGVATPVFHRLTSDEDPLGNANGYIEAGSPYALVFAATLPPRPVVASASSAPTPAHNTLTEEVEALPATPEDLEAYTVRLELLPYSNASGATQPDTTPADHALQKNGLLREEKVTYEFLPEELADKMLVTNQTATTYGTGAGMFQVQFRIVNNLGCSRFAPCRLVATLVHNTLGASVSAEAVIAVRVVGSTFHVKSPLDQAEMRDGIPVTLLAGTPSVDGFLVDEYHTGTIFGWMSMPLPMDSDDPEAIRGGVTLRGEGQDGVLCQEILFEDPATGVAERAWGASFTLLTSRPCLSCEVTFHSTEGLGPDPGTAGDGSDEYGLLAFTLTPDATDIVCSSIPDVYFYSRTTSSTFALTVTAVNGYKEPVSWGSWQVGIQLAPGAPGGIVLNGVLSGEMVDGVRLFEGITASGMTGENVVDIVATARTKVYDASANGAVLKEVVMKTCTSTLQLVRYDEPLEPPQMRVVIERESDNCPPDPDLPCYITATTSSQLKMSIPFKIETLREGEGWFQDMAPRNATIATLPPGRKTRLFLEKYKCKQDGISKICTSSVFELASTYSANDRVDETGENVQFTYGAPRVLASATFSPDTNGDPRNTVVKHGAGELAILQSGDGVQSSPVREARMWLCVLHGLVNLQSGVVDEAMVRVCKEVLLTLTPHTPPSYRLLLLRTGTSPIDPDVVLVPGAEETCGEEADSVDFHVAMVYTWPTAPDPTQYFVDYRSTVDVYVTADARGQILVRADDLSTYGASLKYTLMPAVEEPDGNTFGRRISFYGVQEAEGHLLLSSPGVAGLRSSRTYKWAMTEAPGVAVTLGSPEADDGCYHSAARAQLNEGYLDFRAVPGGGWSLEGDGAVEGVAFPVQVRVVTAGGQRAYTHPASRVKVAVERSPTCDSDDTPEAEYSIYTLSGSTLQASDLYTTHGQVTIWVVVHGVCARCRVTATVCYAAAATLGMCLSPPGTELPLLGDRVAQTGDFEVRSMKAAQFEYGVLSQSFAGEVAADGGVELFTGDLLRIEIAPAVQLPAAWVDVDAPVPAEVYTALDDINDIGYRKWYDSLRRYREVVRKQPRSTLAAPVDNPPAPPPTLSVVWLDASPNAPRYGNGGFLREGGGDCGMSDVVAVPSRELKGKRTEAGAGRNIEYAFAFTRSCARCAVYMTHYSPQGTVVARYPVKANGALGHAVQPFSVRTCGLQWLFHKPQPAALVGRPFASSMLYTDLNGVAALAGGSAAGIEVGTRGGNGYGGDVLLERWPGLASTGAGVAVMRARFFRACWVCELRAGFRVREVAVVSTPKYFLVMNSSLTTDTYSATNPTATLQLTGYLADEHGDRAVAAGGPSFLQWQQMRSRRRVAAVALNAIDEAAVATVRAVRGEGQTYQASVAADIAQTRSLRVVTVNEGTPTAATGIVIEGPTRGYVPRVEVDGSLLEVVTVGLRPFPPLNFTIAPTVLLLGTGAQTQAVSGKETTFVVQVVGETTAAQDGDSPDEGSSAAVRMYHSAVTSLAGLTKTQRTVKLKMDCTRCPECGTSGLYDTTLDHRGYGEAQVTITGTGSCDIEASPPSSGPLSVASKAFLEMTVAPPPPVAWMWSDSANMKVTGNVSAAAVLEASSVAGRDIMLLLTPFDPVAGVPASLEDPSVLQESSPSFTDDEVTPQGCVEWRSTVSSDTGVALIVRFAAGFERCRVRAVRGLPTGTAVHRELEVVLDAVASVRVVTRTHFSGVPQNLTGLTVPLGKRAGVDVFAAQAGQEITVDVETRTPGLTGVRAAGDRDTKVTWELRRRGYDPAAQASTLQRLEVEGTMQGGVVRLRLTPPFDTRPLDCCVENCGVVCPQCCTIRDGAAHVPFHMTITAVVSSEQVVIIDLGELTIVSQPVAAAAVLHNADGEHIFQPYRLEAAAEAHPPTLSPPLEGFSVSMKIAPLDRPLFANVLSQKSDWLVPAWAGKPSASGDGPYDAAQATTHSLGVYRNLPIRLLPAQFGAVAPYLVLQFATVPPCRARLDQSAQPTDPSGIDQTPVVDGLGTCSAAGGSCDPTSRVPTCAAAEVRIPAQDAALTGGVQVGRPSAIPVPNMRLELSDDGFVALPTMLSTVPGIHPFSVSTDTGSVMMTSALQVEQLRQVDFGSGGRKCEPASSLTDAEFFRPYGGRSQLIPEEGDATTWAWPKGFVCPTPATSGVGFEPSPDGSGVVFVRPGEVMELGMSMYAFRGVRRDVVPLGATPHSEIELEVLCEYGGVQDGEQDFAVRYLHTNGSMVRVAHLLSRRPIERGASVWRNVSFEGRCPFTHVILRTVTEAPQAAAGEFPAVLAKNGVSGWVARVPIFRVLMPKTLTDAPPTPEPPEVTLAPQTLPTAQVAVFGTLSQPVMDLFQVAYEADVFSDPRVTVPAEVRLRWLCQVPVDEWFLTHLPQGNGTDLAQIPTEVNAAGEDVVKDAPVFITEAMKADAEVCEHFEEGDGATRRGGEALQGDAEGAGQVMIVDFEVEWLAAPAPSTATLYRVLADLTADPTSSFHTLLTAQSNALVTSRLSLPNGTVLAPPPPPEELVPDDEDEANSTRGVNPWEAAGAPRPLWWATAALAALAVLGAHC